MAMSKLEVIMEIFAGHGKQQTLVAIIQDGTTENEKCIIGTVKDIFLKPNTTTLLILLLLWWEKW